MIHVAVWWAFNQFIRFVFDVPTEIDKEGTVIIAFENIYLADLVSLSGIILIVILSHLSYVFVETKFNQPVEKKNDTTIYFN